MTSNLSVVKFLSSSLIIASRALVELTTHMTCLWMPFTYVLPRSSTESRNCERLLLSSIQKSTEHVVTRPRVKMATPAAFTPRRQQRKPLPLTCEVRRRVIELDDLTWISGC